MSWKSLTPREHDECVVFWDHVKIMRARDWRYHMVLRIPIDQKCSIPAAMWLRAEGRERGPLDYLVACKSGNYIGMWLEFKRGKNKLSKEQEAFVKYAEFAGYLVNVCYSAEEGILRLTEYFDKQKSKFKKAA